ncbi:hypothetical protein THMIRHAS_14380 [Thiosulfatimonas sediminis]|uniref:DUF2065 domain-containing protein n=1 Tax=Thiosulfatimonas sediminis TaxID=2675054 RepID=A0A6F8PVB6_9GAMM|nr:DUF2065 domain-containing protein [Thiosulfatimonas sediminis]BBP46065.1 hypothetical protein THMIRHAS_14380 [Thiosulfatimonas sediminis]
MFETLLAAIALVFIIEGLLPFVFPEVWKKMMAEASALPEGSLRTMGLVSITIGLLLLLIFS